MRLTISIQDGPYAGKRMELSPPGHLSVGRGAVSDWPLPADRFLSTRHFEISHSAGGWILRDLDSANGTFVGGRRVTELALTRDCAVLAGRTTFLVAPEVDVVSMLARSQPLFTILDAARTPRVLELLSSASERFECLYNGESAVHLAACAPYLVELAPKSRLLRRLVREGWGKSWGIFFVCERPFEEVRKHFRQFLEVKDEAGADYYFRFYDPRVLRAFFGSSTPAEQAEFLGPVSAVWADEPAVVGGASS